MKHPPEYYKQYAIDNAEHLKEYRQKYFENNKEVIYARNREYRKNNKDKIAAQRKAKYIANKEVISRKNKEYRENNKEKVAISKKEERLKNIEKYRAYGKDHYQRNKDIYKQRAKNQFEQDKIKHHANGVAWAKAHPEKIKEISKKHHEKYRGTPKGNLHSTISKRINETLLKGMKAGRPWETLVGFTIDQLMQHLEKLFTPEMTWDNYGSYWHIDHKLPVAVFNFERPGDIDFHICWSLKNLQPLEARENLSKGAKIDKPFQPSLLLQVGSGGVR